MSRVPGRILFGIAIVFFGAAYLFYGRFAGGLPPVPPWAPGAPPLAYVLGAVLVVAGLGIALGMRTRACAAVVGTVFVACALLLHTLKIGDVIANAEIRTGAFEAFSLGCVALVLAGNDRRSVVVRAGRYGFAVSMVVFGVQHFMLANFIASLVPSWLPFHLFWAYLTGVGFIAAGVAIGTGLRASLGATWLGIMFLSWVVVLHLPRSIAARTNGDEWTSLFVALGLGAGAWTIGAAGALTGRAGRSE